TNQMESTLDVSFPYSFLRNGMPTLPHPGLYASDVQLNGGQTHIPDSHFDPFRECLFKKPRDRSATEGCFKRKIKFLDNSAFEQALAFLPGGAVRFHLRDTRIPRGDLSRGDVRVEIFHSVRQEHRSGDAAFSSAIGSRQQDRKSTRLNSSHVSISYAVFCLKKKKNNNNTSHCRYPYDRESCTEIQSHR